MPLTPNWDIYYADTSTADSIEDITAAVATSVEEALDLSIGDERQQRSYKWADATARTAQAGMSEGDVGDQADTEQRWRYSGTTWVNITTGLIPVVPTSVAGTGVTVTSSGRIVLSGSSTINVNGVFTTAFDNYLIHWDTPTRGATDGTVQLRVAGVNAAAASSYGTQRTWGTASATTTANTSSTSWSVDTGSAGSAAGATGRIELFGPALAAPTRGIMQWYNGASTTAMYNGTGTLYHSVATAYDGFTYVASGMTGSIRVYGYNNL